MPIHLIIFMPDMEYVASSLHRNHFICGIHGISFLAVSISAVLSSALVNAQQKHAPGAQQEIKDKHGALIQFPSAQRNIYLLFSAHEFGEGGDHIAKVLKQNKAGGSFFFTGDFFRDPKNKALIKKLIRDGHYIGVHSDKHLLYNDWTKRDSLFVTKDEFDTDLQNSLRELKRMGAKKGKWFLPPYEWYNDSIVKWSEQQGLSVINFTPGTGTNADYTYPEMSNYRSSEQLLKRLYEVENTKGLAGYLLLIHLGTDARRADKFYLKLGEIIRTLRGKGYQFVSLP